MSVSDCKRERESVSSSRAHSVPDSIADNEVESSATEHTTATEQSATEHGQGSSNSTQSSNKAQHSNIDGI